MDHVSGLHCTVRRSLLQDLESPCDIQRLQIQEEGNLNIFCPMDFLSGHVQFQVSGFLVLFYFYISYVFKSNILLKKNPYFYANSITLS